MQAFQAALKPSPWLRGGSVLLHGTGMLAALLYFDGVWRLLLGVLLLLSAAWAWFWQSGHTARTVCRIDVDAHGRATVWAGDGVAYEAVLLPGSVVARYWLVLHWAVGTRVLRHWVSADMTDAPAFRRLKVWVRWAQESPEAA